MIEVLVSSGTDADRKTRLLEALVEALDGAGTDPNDIMVFFAEIDRAVAPSAAAGLRHQSQASNHATVVVAALRTTVGEVVRCLPNFAPVPYIVHRIPAHSS